MPITDKGKALFVEIQRALNIPRLPDESDGVYNARTALLPAYEAFLLHFIEHCEALAPRPDEVIETKRDHLDGIVRALSLIAACHVVASASKSGIKPMSMMVAQSLADNVVGLVQEAFTFSE